MALRTQAFQPARFYVSSDICLMKSMLLYLMVSFTIFRSNKSFLITSSQLISGLPRYLRDGFIASLNVNCACVSCCKRNGWPSLPCGITMLYGPAPVLLYKSSDEIFLRHIMFYADQSWHLWKASMLLAVLFDTVHSSLFTVKYYLLRVGKFVVSTFHSDSGC